MGAAQSAEVRELLAAAEEGDLGTVRKLVRKSSDRRALLNERDSDGATALLLAAGSRKADVGTLRRDKIIELLINFGADVSVADHRRGWTALHVACSIGAVDTVKLLLERGCSVYARDVHGLTPQQVVVSGIHGCAPHRRLSEGGDSDDEEVLEDGRVVRKPPDHRLPLPRALLQEIWPLFKARSSWSHWSLGVHVEARVPDGKRCLRAVVHFPSQAAFEESCACMDLVQIASMRDRPWAFAPILGCFQRISTGVVTESDFGSLQVALDFPAEDLAPRHSFRCLYVRGELSDDPEAIAAASDLVDTDHEGRLSHFAQQSFFRPEPVEGAEDEDAGSSSGESDDGGGDQRDGNYVDGFSAEGDSDSSSDGGGAAGQEEDRWGDAWEAQRVVLRHGAPWELDPLPNERMSALRDGLLKQRILALSSNRNIWSSRWTKLNHPPPDSFVVDPNDISEHAKVALAEDANLAKARLELVPSRISERTFWWVYFWHVELIKLQVTDLLHEFPMPPELEAFADGMAPAMRGARAESELTQTEEDLSDEEGLSDEFDEEAEEDADAPEGVEDEVRVVLQPIAYTPESQMAILHQHTKLKLERIRAKEAGAAMAAELQPSPRRVRFQSTE